MNLNHSMRTDIVVNSASATEDVDTSYICRDASLLLLPRTMCFDGWMASRHAVTERMYEHIQIMSRHVLYSVMERSVYSGCVMVKMEAGVIVPVGGLGF